MRRYAIFTAIACCLGATGCATVGETIIDSIFDSVFGSSTENRADLDDHVLKRKGIKPGSKRHKRLVFEEEFYESTHRDQD